MLQSKALLLILALSLVAHSSMAADLQEDSKDAGSASAEAEKASSEEKTAKAEKMAPGRKSPALAGGLAFFPGIAVHGAGHMYAGSWMKGLGLLAIEGIAIGVGAAQVTGGIEEFQKLADGASGGKFPTDTGGVFTKVGILTVSTMAFLWTWFDDMAGAPIAANEYNKLQEEAQAQLHLQPRQDGVALALSKKF